eukprot:TRINITY_DN4189_c0_g1_i2.p3 TRINITY_DN4189_c0_g1~~TRINITY_DN4189_c0_g1_i2.p3  ORF type:complete len:101 (-),score=25.98 TRINITY_DN4189_c0_g1_i2:91-363(-)
MKVLLTLAAVCFCLCAAEYNESAVIGGCTTCGAAATTNIASACAQYTSWSQSCCQCIAQHESSGNYHACNSNTNGSTDVRTSPLYPVSNR